MNNNYISANIHSMNNNYMWANIEGTNDINHFYYNITNLYHPNLTILDNNLPYINSFTNYIPHIHFYNYNYISNTPLNYIGANAPMGYTGAHTTIGYTGAHTTMGYTGAHTTMGYTGAHTTMGYTGAVINTIGQSYYNMIGPNSYYANANIESSINNYDNAKLSINTGEFKFESLRIDKKTHLYNLSYKNKKYKVVLKINENNGQPYSNLKFMEMINYIEEIIKLNIDEEVVSRCKIICEQDYYIKCKLLQKISITI